RKVIPIKLFHALAKVGSIVYGFPMIFKMLEKNLVFFDQLSQKHNIPHEFWSEKSELKLLLDSLWVSPDIIIDVTKNKLIDIYEMKQVGQLSSDEMRNRIANQLVDLPDYVARVKIKGEPEHLIQTLDPKKQADKTLYGQLLNDRIERIKLINRTDGYTRPRQ